MLGNLPEVIFAMLFLLVVVFIVCGFLVGVLLVITGDVDGVVFLVVLLLLLLLLLVVGVSLLVLVVLKVLLGSSTRQSFGKSGQHDKESVHSLWQSHPPVRFVRVVSPQRSVHESITAKLSSISTSDSGVVTSWMHSSPCRSSTSSMAISPKIEERSTASNTI